MPVRMSRSLFTLGVACASALSCATAPKQSTASRPTPAVLAAPGVVAVKPVALYVDARLEMEVAQGELQLPGRFFSPRLAPAPGESGVTHVYLWRRQVANADHRRSRRQPADERETRVPVDAALLARAGASLRKNAVLAEPSGAPGADEPVAWQVFALRRHGAKEARLELRVEPDAPVQPVSWAIGASAPGGKDVLEKWAGCRLAAQDAMRIGDGPLQRPILISAVGAYGLSPQSYWARLAENRDRDRMEGAPSLLALLGGRAAVDETLQLGRRLDVAAEGGDASEVIPVAGVSGIEVQAHPWKRMLAGRTAPRVPLADLVPLDRSLIYLPQPKEALSSLENGGARFLQRVSSFAGQVALDYSVVERYLADLGLGDGLGRKLIKAGAIDQAVIFTPDLSFLAGTDVTVVAQISPMFQPLLPLADGELQEKQTPAGKAYRARRGSRVFLSTSRAELERALALHASGGEGSTGRSEEFAVMLLNLAPTERTQAFAYLSDPFIRRLLGPEVRIGQVRREGARASMEVLAGAAFLRRQDVPEETPTIEALKRLGYLPAGFPETAFTLSPDGRVSSATYGPLERLRPVSRLGIATVTQSEAREYEKFRESYSRYWQRYFDPIAVRLDANPGAAYALETFVLPLQESSIYREPREKLAPRPRPAMTAPRWNFPAPVSLSIQLPEEVTEGARNLHLARDLRELWEPLGDLADEVLQSMVPNLHVAFPDAAPIMQIGGGSVFGAAAAEPNRVARLGEASVTMLLAAVTRPMVVAIELKDPDRVRRALERVAVPYRFIMGRRGGTFDFRLAREDDGRLIVSIDLFRVVTIRQSIRIEDRWLVAANDTTLPARLVSGTQKGSPAAASLSLEPAAIRLGLPAAWQRTVEADADAAWAAQHWLAPWLEGGATVQEAQRSSRALFGAAPELEQDALLPASNNTREHRRYGTPARARLPAHDPGKDFGLFEGITKARVEMSFEGDGLRTRVTWN